MGLIAGFIARAIMGSKSGLLGNLVLGVLGAFIGGWIGSAVFGVGLQNFWSIQTWILAILGSVVLLAIYNAIVGGRSKD